MSITKHQKSQDVEERIKRQNMERKIKYKNMKPVPRELQMLAYKIRIKKQRN